MKSEDSTKKKRWINRDTKEGFARILDGYCIAAGIALFSFLGGRLDLSVGDAVNIVIAFMVCLLSSVVLRKRKRKLKNDH